MTKPGFEKKSGVAKAYDDSHKGVREVRDLRANIPKLVRKILVGDFTRMNLYGGHERHPVDVEDHAKYDPVLKEGNILAARLERLIGKAPDDPIAIVSTVATAKKYPQLARDYNAEAFYTLPKTVREKTKAGKNPDTKHATRPTAETKSGKTLGAQDEDFKDIGIKQEVNSEQDESIVSKSVTEKKNEPGPEVLTSGSAKRGPEDDIDQPGNGKRQRKKRSSINTKSGAEKISKLNHEIVEGTKSGGEKTSMLNDQVVEASKSAEEGSKQSTKSGGEEIGMLNDRIVEASKSVKKAPVQGMKSGGEEIGILSHQVVEAGKSVHEASTQGTKSGGEEVNNYIGEEAEVVVELVAEDPSQEDNSWGVVEGFEPIN